MTVREVLIYPHPALKQAAAPVGSVDDEACSLARDLVDTMRANERCVGLAASQIGVLSRCIVVDVTGHRRAVSCHGLIVLFDPVVERMTGADVAREGCLSVPELTANVRRATHVSVNGLDPRGDSVTIGADAFEARALQHEIDHLDGILFLDRVANLETDVFRRVDRR